MTYEYIYRKKLINNERFYLIVREMVEEFCVRFDEYYLHIHSRDITYFKEIHLNNQKFCSLNFLGSAE